MGWAMRHVVNGQRVKAKSPADVLAPGDVVYVEKDQAKGNWIELRQVPAVEGAHGCDGPAYRPRAGAGRRLLLRVVRIQPRHAGLCASPAPRSSRSSTRRRSTMATRRPPWCSTRPITIRHGNQVWEPQELRRQVRRPFDAAPGIERSRNLMTVRLANDMGMPLVAEYAERFGIYDKMLPVPADGARRRRDDGHAHGHGLCDHRQWRQGR
jgi:penicillin-binding protein 1A